MFDRVTRTLVRMDAMNTTATAMASPRSLVCHYNPSMVAAALVVSLLGAFTSTQLMCQARGARTLSGVLIWTILGSLVFGFCATWCLHFLGMLSCEFDVHIGLNSPLTILSAVLAVSFTFGALSTDLVLQRWRQPRRKKATIKRSVSPVLDRHLVSDLESRQSLEPLLHSSQELSGTWTHHDVINTVGAGPSQSTQLDQIQVRTPGTDALEADAGTSHVASKRSGGLPINQEARKPMNRSLSDMDQSDSEDTDGGDPNSTFESQSRFSLSNTYPGAGSAEFNGSRSNATDESRRPPASNTLRSALVLLLSGFTVANVTKGFVWSIALTNMHFMGVKALDIPGGFVALSLGRVILCALISWCVCCVGVILMAEMEINIKQQVLFSVVAASGVAAVHFSGMYACSFWSTQPPSSERGYPTILPVVIASTAILTCMASTGLLAHTAAVARDKLADVLSTRRRLWAAVVQKENAEAIAAARSEFIASASHEIRTPLHQLQGYTDLLSESNLSEEDRLLLLAIQHATKSLSMITSNVLDWSRLEKGEAVCRPVAVDVRLACETIVHLLPNRVDNVDVELLVVVAPEVPSCVLTDETYLQRILMNLLSNSFKFTTSGYVMLLLHQKGDYLHMRVQDSGSGIPRAFLPQLFEPYKQVQARGAERGTGLGLSIIKRLLHQIQGSIGVESRCQDDLDVGVANSGSTFTITIPVATLEPLSDLSSLNLIKQIRIAIMHDGKNRDIEGLTAAWMAFGAEVSQVQVIEDVSSDPEAVIWADLDFLKQQQHDARINILSQQQHLVLVPYKNRILLEEILGPTPPINIVPIRKPLIWHCIVQAVVDARQVRSTPELVKDIKLSSRIDSVTSSADVSSTLATLAKKKVVLLVEDNKVNQKLGAKMLAMLNYDVLLAEDGQEAVDIVTEYSLTIDVILMDQSMPRKDGVTATREIRQMEAAGSLGKRQTIIAVTAAGGPEAQALFSEAGVDMFLSKPLSLTKLKQTLSQYVNG